MYGSSAAYCYSYMVMTKAGGRHGGGCSACTPLAAGECARHATRCYQTASRARPQHSCCTRAGGKTGVCPALETSSHSTLRCVATAPPRQAAHTSTVWRRPGDGSERTQHSGQTPSKKHVQRKVRSWRLFIFRHRSTVQIAGRCQVPCARSASVDASAHPPAAPGRGCARHTTSGGP